LFSCFNVMKKQLRRNICRLDDHVLLSEVRDLPACRATYIGGTLEYACHFWTNHLVRIPAGGPDVKEVLSAINKFFKRHLLFWIEVLSLTGNLDIGVHALNNVQQWYTSVSSIIRCPLRKHMLMLVQAGVSCKWANDGCRLLLEYFDAIHDSPSQIYHSALPFSPSSSQLRKYYATELSQEVEVVKGLPVEWGMCSRTVALDDRPYTGMLERYHCSWFGIQGYHHL